MKFIISSILFFSGIALMAQPANDNCASATVLSVDAALSCGQSNLNATLQGSECYTNYGGGSTESTSWYRFTANNDSLILNFIQTNTPNCYPLLVVYGPVASGGGCLPACGTEVYMTIQNGDPGSHILLTGLATTGNHDYLIQVQNNSCGGSGAGYNTFCINVQQPEGNNTPAGADQLNACGTAFTNSTNGGYWQTGTSTGFNNLDNNNGTTCGGCAAGDDTPFIINNVSWTYFCALTNGTWQVTVNNISGCTLPAPNQGVQASIFTGTTGALVNQGNSPNPISPGGSWTSAVITVNNGQCAYLMIDGFAGDACNYSVTLTNLTGGCIVLPIELVSFDAIDLGEEVKLNWITATEISNDYFILERSSDGEHFSFVSVIDGAGNSNSMRSYSFNDNSSFNGEIYYRLRQVDYDGNSTISGYAKIVRQNDQSMALEIFPNPASDGLNPQIMITGAIDENYSYTLYDITGKQIEFGRVFFESVSEQFISIQNILQSGVYFVQISNRYGKTITQKLMVE